MKVITEQQPVGAFGGAFAFVGNLFKTTEHLTHAVLVVSEIVDEAAIVSKDIVLLSLNEQKNQLLAREQATLALN